MLVMNILSHPIPFLSVFFFFFRCVLWAISNLNLVPTGTVFKLWRSCLGRMMWMLREWCGWWWCIRLKLFQAVKMSTFILAGVGKEKERSLGTATDCYLQLSSSAFSSESWSKLKRMVEIQVSQNSSERLNFTHEEVSGSPSPLRSPDSALFDGDDEDDYVNHADGIYYTTMWCDVMCWRWNISLCFFSSYSFLYHLLLLFVLSISCKHHRHKFLESFLHMHEQNHQQHLSLSRLLPPPPALFFSDPSQDHTWVFYTFGSKQEKSLSHDDYHDDDWISDLGWYGWTFFCRFHCN